MGFEKNTINLKDIRTLPVNNTKLDKTLTMRLMNSKNEEVARS
jgi:EAL domain-containing protein (putative c-di-GMP-specific phosphodiesterase class I)